MESSPRGYTEVDILVGVAGECEKRIIFRV
jgi:hypothetical protein